MMCWIISGTWINHSLIPEKHEFRHVLTGCPSSFTKNRRCDTPDFNKKSKVKISWFLQKINGDYLSKSAEDRAEAEMMIEFEYDEGLHHQVMKEEFLAERAAQK